MLTEDVLVVCGFGVDGVGLVVLGDEESEFGGEFGGDDVIEDLDWVGAFVLDLEDGIDLGELGLEVDSAAGVENSD